MHDAFVSHSSEDKQLADALVHHLEAQKIRCWVAPRDITAGKSYAEAILDGLSDAQVMILVLSGSANSSPHVQREVERALSLGKAVVPVRVEDVTPSGALDYFISSVHWIDAFDPPIEEHFQVLADHVRALTTGQEPPRQPASVAPPAAEPAAPAAAKSRSMLPFVLIAVAVLLGVGLWILGPRIFGSGPEEGPEPPPAVAGPPPPPPGPTDPEPGSGDEAELAADKKRVEQIAIDLRSLRGEMQVLTRSASLTFKQLPQPDDIPPAPEPLSSQRAEMLENQLKAETRNIRSADLSAERLLSRAEVLAEQAEGLEFADRLRGSISEVASLRREVESGRKQIAKLVTSSSEHADRMEVEIEAAVARNATTPPSPPPTPPPVAAAPSVSRYSGNVGRQAANFSLTWYPDRSVSGTYSYPNWNRGKTYVLRGQNPREGYLELVEYTDGTATADLKLTKRIVGGSVQWAGKMYNRDGKVFEMKMTKK